MKTKLLILLTSIVLMANCSDGDTVDPIPNVGSIKLDLYNNDSIRLWCRSTCSFEALEDGLYKIESLDISIASVKVDGKTFVVKAKKPGVTHLKITNNLGDEKVLKCTTRTFADVWEESPDLARIYHNSAIVAAEDKMIAQKIREELKPISLNRGYQYTFVEGTNKMFVLIPAQGGPVEGTYLWDIDNQILTLNYNGRSEKFSCDIQSEYPNFFEYTPRFIIALKQDLTQEYVVKYPEAGIKDVYIIRYIMALGDYWLTARK